MNFLLSILGFIITIGVLVAFHEYGHFWVARKLGVKVLTYSLGFGKTLWSTRRGPDRIEYRVAALPLGGFVKMLDEREGPVDPSERHRAFNRQPLWKRALIVLAGPVANIVLAVVLWWLMFMIGVQGVLPKVGHLDADSLLAQSGLGDGDVVTRIGSHQIRTLSDLRLAVLDSAIEHQKVSIGFQHDGMSNVGELDLSRLDPLAGSVGEQPKDILKTIGFKVWTPPGDAKIHRILPGSPAASAGLQSGDVIDRINGQTYRDPWILIQRISQSPGKPITLTVSRKGQTHQIRLTPKPEPGKPGTGRIGAEIGLAKPPADAHKMLLTERFNPVTALAHALGRSWDMTALTFRVFGGLLTGQASISNLSGPVAIAEYAGKSLVLGVSTFFGFLALVSLSLAILNLLPVPMLDGGHLLLYAIEGIRGRPVGPRFEDIATRIGLVLLVGLMTLAFYNDIARLMH